MQIIKNLVQLRLLFTANGSNCVSGKRVVKNFRIEKKVPVISFKSPISTTWHNANGTHGFECVAPSDCSGYI